MSISKKYETEWELALRRHSLFFDPESIWAYSGQSVETEPSQGWKLHVSATILTARKVLDRAAPILRARDISFKVPRALAELEKINCGLFYGFAQVGKFLTVYPRTPDDAVDLAAELDRQTCRLGGPSVPYDSRYRERSQIYYRYGAFGSKIEIQTAQGKVPAIVDPNGNPQPDVRGPEYAPPPWAPDPFLQDTTRLSRGRPKRGPLSSRVRAFEAISQRGKGGVYRALYFASTPAPPCIVKEGRRHGETEWDGRDGRWRVMHEEQVLRELKAKGVERVPRVLEGFTEGQNYYLVLEQLGGESLHARLVRSGKRLSVARRLRYGLQVADLLAAIHSAGWVWRDCKPFNIVLLPKHGGVAALDFEGATSIHRTDPEPWGTRMYVPPEWPNVRANPFAQDLYALGVTLFQLYRHHIPSDSEVRPDPSLISKRFPASVRTLVRALLDPDPCARPTALDAAKRLA